MNLSGGSNNTISQSTVRGIAIDRNEAVNWTRSEMLKLLQKYQNKTFDYEGDVEYKFVVEGVLLTGVSLFGLLGNVISVFVLSRPVMKCPFSTLLMGLAVFDTLYLLDGLAIFGLPALSLHYLHTMLPVIISTCFGLGHIGRVASVYITVSITVERYLAIAYPLRHFWQNKFLLPGSILVAIFYNIPKFFELESKLDKETGFNVVSATTLRANHYYMTYYIFWSKFVLIEIIPYFVIIILNCLIIRIIRTSGRFRKECAVADHDTDQEAAAAAKHIHDLNAVAILIAISVLFVLCQSVKIIPDLYEAIFCRLMVVPKGIDCETTPLIEKIISMSHLLLAINSSTNFIIYAFRGEKFREIVTSHCCFCGQPEEASTGRTSLKRQSSRQDSQITEDGSRRHKRSIRSLTEVSRGSHSNNNTPTKNQNYFNSTVTIGAILETAV